MTVLGRKRGEGRRKWIAGVGGVALFVLLGVAVAPGLVRRVPKPAAESLDPSMPTAERGVPAAEPVAVPALAPPVPALDAFDCMILASETVEIGSPVRGLIEEVPVERTDYVEVGQMLARLESAVERAAVRVARARAEREGEVQFASANLALSAKRRQRARELFRHGSMSLDSRDLVETEAALAASELAQARENEQIAALELEQAIAALERRTIRSPVSGFVVERLMAPGEVVDEETILTVAQVDPLRVEVILPSSLFGKVHRGDRAEVFPEAPLDQPRTAEVALVDPVVDGPSGTFGARLLVPNPDHDLPAGLRCSLRFVEDEAAGIASPRDAGA